MICGFIYGNLLKDFCACDLCDWLLWSPLGTENYCNLNVVYGFRVLSDCRINLYNVWLRESTVWSYCGKLLNSIFLGPFFFHPFFLPLLFSDFFLFPSLPFCLLHSSLHFSLCVPPSLLLISSLPAFFLSSFYLFYSSGFLPVSLRLSVWYISLTHFSK